MRFRRKPSSSTPPAGSDDAVHLLTATPASGPGFPQAGLMLAQTFSDGTSLDPTSIGLVPVGAGLEAIPQIKELVADISRPTAIAILESSEFDRYSRGEGPPRTLAISMFPTPHPRQWVEEVSAQRKLLLAIGNTAAWNRADSDIERALLLTQMHVGLISLAVYAYPTGTGYTPPQ